MKTAQLTQREKWHKEQIVAMLYKNVTGAIVGSISNIAIVSFVLAPIYPTIGLLSWFLVGQTLNLVRFYIHHLYVNNAERFETQTWLQLHRTLTLLSGSIYGTLALFFFSSEHPLYQILVIMLAGGMGAAAVGTHSVDRPTFQLFLYSAVVPLILRSLLEDTQVHSTLAAMLCLLILVMVRAGNQTQKIMIDNIYMSQSLRYRATHDGLVDLLNREEFQNEFSKLVANEPTDGSVVSLIFIDLDNFKMLNDTYGHQAGDDALIRIGDIIRNSIRKSDTAARFGGDEFMILIRSKSIEEPNAVAKKILHKIDLFQQSMKETSAGLGASIGIGYSKNTDISFNRLLRVADQACYRAKDSGKGRICLEELNAH